MNIEVRDFIFWEQTFSKKSQMIESQMIESQEVRRLILSLFSQEFEGRKKGSGSLEIRLISLFIFSVCYKNNTDTLLGKVQGIPSTG